jgi:hypothetical protein
MTTTDNSMTMTKLVSLAAHYNDKGAAFLEGNNYKGAIVYFAKGIQEACKLAVISCQNDTNQSPDMNLSLDACMNLIDSKDAKSAAYTSEDQQQESPYMHMRPIRLPPMYLNHVDTNSVLSTILVFNQALAHHLMGIKNNHSSSLKKALKLYECGFNLLIIQEDMWASSTCYILACLNNMSLIFRCRNKTIASTKKCFQDLLSSLMFLTHSDHQGSTDLDIYFQTVCHIIFQGTSPAPAA